MRAISYTEFKELIRTIPAKDIKDSKSFEVTSNGELLCIVVIPKTSHERGAVRKLAELGNNVYGGKEI